MTESQILLLENTRFHAGETQNCPAFAAQLGRLADYFVQDAFGTSHRAHASTVGVTRHVQLAAAGYLMERELQFLQGAILDHPARPLVAIVGGAKVSTKLPVIESLLDRCDAVLLGGGMIFTFYRALGYDTGASLVEDNMIDLAGHLLETAKGKGKPLVLPTDVIVADDFSNDANTAVALVEEGTASTRDEIREWMSGNLCRCGAYNNIVDAVSEVLDAQKGVRV